MHLEPHGLFVAKLIALREKDANFDAVTQSHAVQCTLMVAAFDLAREIRLFDIIDALELPSADP